MADHLSSKDPFPQNIYLSPGVVMSSNLHLFREIRLAGKRFDDSLLTSPNSVRVAGKMEK
jgi:hypothetical protein